MFDIVLVMTILRKFLLKNLHKTNGETFLASALPLFKL